MTNFLVPVTVNSLPQISDLEGKQGMFILPDGSININRKNGTWMIINKQSDHAGVLKPVDIPVIQAGDSKWWWAGAGTYPNAGGLTIDKQGILSFDGSDWKELELDIPQIGGDTQNIEMVLGDFILPPIDTTIKNYLWAGADQNLFGVAPISGLLKADNTLVAYTESGFTFRVWKDINVTDFDFIKLFLVRIGGNISTPAYVNLIGKKADGTLTLLVKPDHDPATGLMENVEVDVSEYVSISLYMAREDAEPIKPTVEFIKKGGLLEYDAVKKYILANKGKFTNDIDLIDFGCKGDGITDDTSMFYAAVVLAMATGRRIYGRSNTYKVSSITIPKTMEWKKVEIYGDSVPIPTFGTIGNIPNYASLQKGMRIISDLQDITRGVIYVGAQNGFYLQFNNVFLVLRNMTISCYSNPNVNGIHSEHAVQCMYENVVVDTAVYNVHTAKPTYNSCGIILPGHSNSAFVYLRNVAISGFKTGLVVYEHTDGDAIAIHGCINAFSFESTDHSSYFKRVLCQRNTNVVVVNGRHLFEIAQLNCEYVGSYQSDSNNDWQKTQYELKDPNSLGIGNITYANVRGGIGMVPTFRINGGGNVIVKRVGSDVRLTGDGITDPNPIP